MATFHKKRRLTEQFGLRIDPEMRDNINHLNKNSPVDVPDEMREAFSARLKTLLRKFPKTNKSSPV